MNFNDSNVNSRRVSYITIILAAVITLTVIVIANALVLPTMTNTTTTSTLPTSTSTTTQTSTSTTTPTTTGSYGTVRGQVTIGPLCPTEPCDKVQNLTGYSLAFTGNSVDYFYAPLSASGNFSIKLEAGTYAVTLKPSCQWIGCNRVFPKNVSVLVDETTGLDISIDTGIR